MLCFQLAAAGSLQRRAAVALIEPLLTESLILYRTTYTNLTQPSIGRRFSLEIVSCGLRHST